MIKILIYISIVLFLIDFAFCVFFIIKLRKNAKKDGKIIIGKFIKICAIILIGFTIIMLIALPVSAMMYYMN